ncbi:hypothetical protein CTA2_2371 [Colletotrichum tanaceti]|nr:hypothetical protein CTA2_2371 [Colletotrichum tanaceti]
MRLRLYLPGTAVYKQEVGGIFHLHNILWKVVKRLCASGPIWQRRRLRSCL